MQSGNGRQRKRRRGKNAGLEHILSVSVDGRRNVTIRLSDSRIRVINRRVMQRLFNLSESEVPQHYKKTAHLNSMRRKLSGNLGSLFSYQSASRYSGTLREAISVAEELHEAAAEYRAHDLSRKLEDFVSPPRWVPKRIAESPMLSRWTASPQRVVDQTKKMVAREYAAVTLEEVRQWLELPPASRVTIDGRLLERFYQPVIEAVGQWRLFFYTGPVLEFLRKTDEVAREGSPQAAHLFYKWTAAKGTLADHNAPLDTRVDRLFAGMSVPWHSLFFSDAQAYAQAAEIGMLGVMSALDIEHERSHASGFLKRAWSAASAYSGMLADVAELANKLLKMYVDPSSASEMMAETPVGMRSKMLGSMKKSPGTVALFDQLREDGVDARSYMQFLDTSDRKVPGARTTRYVLVQELVQGKSRKEAAAWIVGHPGFWDAPGLEERIYIAANARSPARKLDILKSWERYDGVRRLIAEKSNWGDKRLLALMRKVSALPPEIISRLTPDNFEQLLRQGYASQPQHASPARQRPDAWIDALYSGSPALAGALHGAYARLSEASAANRLETLSDYVVENIPEGEQESVLRQYASSINEMPPALVAAVFNDSFLFSNGRMLASFGAFLADPSSVSRLLDAYGEGKNAYAMLLDRIKPSSQEYGNIETAVEEAAAGYSLSPAPVRIAVFGHTSEQLKDFVEKRLDDAGIEITYLDGAAGSTLPDLDAPVIIYTWGMEHSSGLYGKLRQDNRIVRASHGGRTGLVRDIRELASELRQQASDA